MKLLFDQNISFKILNHLSEKFLDSASVYNLQLQDSNDIHIWKYARKNQFTIVTFDGDFADISNVNNAPPKVIWLRTVNMTTKNIVRPLDQYSTQIENFINNEPEGIFQILTL